MSQDQVLVPPEVYEGLESLRQSGDLDPGDRSAARRVAADRGYDHVESWLENVDEDVYAAAARGGFTAQTEN